MTDVPLMRMGLLGFEQEQYVYALLKTRALVLQWERWPVMEADALWVNGAHAQVVRGGLVRVPSGDPSKPATLLNLAGIDRPTAFALPLGDPQLPAQHVFDTRSPESINLILRRFEAWLQPLAIELALARQLAARRDKLTSPIYQLSCRGALIAVLDVSGDVGYLPTLLPSAVAGAEWHGRPRGAGSIPEHFQRASMAQVMWQYVLRTPDDLLPPKYRTLPIYLRRKPRIPHRLVKDTHLAILSELASTPLTFRMLQERTGLAEAAMATALAALYFAGGITADPSRAAAPTAARARKLGEHDTSMGGLPSSIMMEALPDPMPAAKSGADRATVPAGLDLGRDNR